MPVLGGLFTVDIVEEAAGDLLLLKILQDTEITAMVVIHGMARAFVICAGAVFLCVSHFAISSSVFPVSL